MALSQYFIPKAEKKMDRTVSHPEYKAEQEQTRYVPDFLGSVGLGLFHMINDVTAYLSNTIQVMLAEFVKSSCGRHLVNTAETSVAVLENKQTRSKQKKLAKVIALRSIFPLETTKSN